MDSTAAFLDALNPDQLEAATDTQHRGVLIIAGPGSGKTRTLAARIMHLIHNVGVRPEEIAGVTFTRKAAREMIERVRLMLGEETAKRLTLGTFHSLSLRILRRHAGAAGLPNDFGVIDAEDRTKMLRETIRALQAAEKSKESSSFQEADRQTNDRVIALISRAQSVRATPEQLALGHETEEPPRDLTTHQFAAAVMATYEARKRELHVLDFDDLLGYAAKAAERHGLRVVGEWDHFLVDEFQDTNSAQFDLVAAIARSRMGSPRPLTHVTVVGDPDQSIYAWRAADVRNLGRLQALFGDDMHTVFLARNYRSTNSIVQCSQAVIRADEQRAERPLWTAHPAVTPVTIRGLHSSDAESDFIATEVLRLVAHSHGVFDYGDVAVLGRTHRITSELETVFTRRRIPYVVIGGVRFFDRREIKDLVCYMRVAYCESDRAAFERVVNVPKRGIGGQTVAHIATHALKLPGASLLGTLEAAQPGGRFASTAGLSRARGSEVQSFLKAVRAFQAAVKAGGALRDALGALIQQIEYVAYLEKTDEPKDTIEGRVQRVNELLKVVAGYDEDMAAKPTIERLGEFLENAVLGGAVDDPTLNSTPVPKTAEEEDAFEDPQAKQKALAARAANKVVVSTIHAAKGLEWPAVFVMAAEPLRLPHKMSKSDAERAEERRLLYVAMTRAKALLYVTGVVGRYHWEDRSQGERLSEFLDPVTALDANFVSRCVVPLTTPILQSICGVLGRPVPKGVADAGSEDQSAKSSNALPDASGGSGLKKFHASAERYDDSSESDGYSYGEGYSYGGGYGYKRRWGDYSSSSYSKRARGGSLSASKSSSQPAAIPPAPPQPTAKPASQPIANASFTMASQLGGSGIGEPRGGKAARAGSKAASRGGATATAVKPKKTTARAKKAKESKPVKQEVLANTAKTTEAATGSTGTAPRKRGGKKTPSASPTPLAVTAKADNAPIVIDDSSVVVKAEPSVIVIDDPPVAVKNEPTRGRRSRPQSRGNARAAEKPPELNERMQREMVIGGFHACMSASGISTAASVVDQLAKTAKSAGKGAAAAVPNAADVAGILDGLATQGRLSRLSDGRFAMVDHDQ